MAILKEALKAVPVVGSVLGSFFNANQQEKQNRRSENFSREMYGRQRADALSDWNMQNAYNDPAAQMQRLKDADLNPNLVYGNGADAGAPAPMRQSQSQQPNFKAPQVDAGGIVQNAMMMKQIQSNIAKTDAETEAIKATTTGTQFKNDLNQKIGLDKMAENYAWATDKVAIESQRANSEYEAFKAGTDNDFGKGSIAAKAQNAKFHQTVQELKNMETRGDVLQAESAIKQFEKRLTDQGISPNSPWYAKILGDLLIEVGILPSITQGIKTMKIK